MKTDFEKILALYPMYYFTEADYAKINENDLKGFSALADSGLIEIVPGKDTFYRLTEKADIEVAEYYENLRLKERPVVEVDSLRFPLLSLAESIVKIEHVNGNRDTAYDTIQTLLDVQKHYLKLIFEVAGLPVPEMNFEAILSKFKSENP